MIQGKVLYGPMKALIGSNWLTVTDEGIHYEGKATPKGKLLGKKVELDIPFSELNCTKMGSTYNIWGQGYSFNISTASNEDAKGLEYIYQRSMEKIMKKLDEEHIMRCNVCGKVFTYTELDVRSSKRAVEEAAQAQQRANMDYLFGSTVRGTIAQGNANAAMNAASEKESKIGRCPHCNSTNVTEISAEEAAKAAETPAAPAASSMDELKKLKELLDMGIITQEEFDAKKKQLLGL